jgi:hypothetical protein
MKLAGDDTAHVEHVVDDMSLSVGVSLDRLDGALDLGGSPRLQQVKPSEDRGERRA